MHIRPKDAPPLEYLTVSSVERDSALINSLRNMNCWSWVADLKMADGLVGRKFQVPHRRGLKG